MQERDDLLVRRARAAQITPDLANVEPPTAQELPLLDDDMLVEQIHKA